MTSDWLQSAGLAFVIEEVALEVAASVAVAALATLRASCDNCSCPLIFIVGIELYRLYRSLTE